METVVKTIDKLVKSRDCAIKALEDINRDLSNEEHVDSSWIKDTIELHSGIGIVERANFAIEIKKLKKEIERLKGIEWRYNSLCE